MGGFPTLKTQKLWSPSFSAMFLVCRTSQDDSKVSAAGRRGLPLTFAPSLECFRRFSVENDFVLCSVFRVYIEWLDFTDRGLKRHLSNVQREDILQNVLIELFYNLKCLAQSVSFRETNSNSVEDLWLNLNKCLSRWWLVSSVHAAVCQFSDDWFHVSSSLCSGHLGTSGSHLASASAAVIVD